MKDTGITRDIDMLGRVCIPKEILKTLKIRKGNTLEIFIVGESIFLKSFLAENPSNIEGGIIRKLDKLGRIVIPSKIRKKFDIQTADSLEVFLKDGAVVLKKYHISCVFCGEIDDTNIYEGKKVCTGCIQKLSKLIQ